MKIKKGSTVSYKDPEISKLYGVGVVTEVTDAEYTILWAQRGSKKYKRSILDQKLADIFQPYESDKELPKERQLHLGATTAGIPFNEHYDRAKVTLLCEELSLSESQDAKAVAEGLKKQLFTKNLALRATTKVTLLRLAELCGTKTVKASEPARQISEELFFGYVLQESDFAKPE
jgi:hypothetical protein